MCLFFFYYLRHVSYSFYLKNSIGNGEQWDFLGPLKFLSYFLYGVAICITQNIMRGDEKKAARLHIRIFQSFLRGSVGDACVPMVNDTMALTLKRGPYWTMSNGISSIFPFQLPQER